jgi:hypothetical protein
LGDDFNPVNLKGITYEAEAEEKNQRNGHPENL